MVTAGSCRLPRAGIHHLPELLEPGARTGQPQSWDPPSLPISLNPGTPLPFQLSTTPALLFLPKIHNPPFPSCYPQPPNPPCLPVIPKLPPSKYPQSQQSPSRNPQSPNSLFPSKYQQSQHLFSLPIIPNPPFPSYYPQSPKTPSLPVILNL